MKPFWRKPAKTLITVLALFMTTGLLGSPVYALENEDENKPADTDQTVTDTENGNTDDASAQNGAGSSGQTGETAPVIETTKGSVTTKLQTNASENLITYLAKSGNSGKLTIELYKIAPAAKDPDYVTYTYPFDSAFTVPGYDLGKYSGTAAGTKYLKDIVATDWEYLAQTLAGKVKESTTISAKYTGTFGQKIENMDAGLYLVLARGTELTDKNDYFKELEAETGTETETTSKLCTVMEAGEYIYYFTPVLVAVPSTNVKTDESMKTSDADWKFNLDVYLKPTEKPFKGKLKITKEVEVLEDREDNTQVQTVTPMTAVFRITGWKSEQDMKDGKPSVYSNVASITIPNGTPVILDNIPIGTYVEVKEIYTGAGYKLTSAEKVYKEITKPTKEDESDIVTFAFTDTFDRRITKGYGVLNSFVKDKNGHVQWTNDIAGPSQSSDQPAQPADPAQGGDQG